jgi:Leucine-rich repeat (LRR) protein
MTLKNLTYKLVLLLAINSCTSEKSDSTFESKINSKDSTAVFSLIDSANTYRIKGELENAKLFISSAKEVSEKLNWGKGLATSYTNLAYINLYENDFEASMENSVEGLRIAEKCDDIHSQGLAN